MMFQSPNTILAGVIGATGLTVVRDLLTGSLSMKPIIGGFVTGTILLSIGLVSVPIASALAVLLLISSVLVNGPAVLAQTGI